MGSGCDRRCGGARNPGFKADTFAGQRERGGTTLEEVPGTFRGSSPGSEPFVNIETQIGIAAAAFTLPSNKRAVRSLVEEESPTLDPVVIERLGIEEVPICDGETASGMAATACREALRRADLDVALVDLIVDYSILPQEFLVPAWNMSNKLQHELGAKKAFTVGFSGGGATNFLVALSSAVAILQANEKLTSALLVGADVTIPGNRILNPQDPVTVLGDSASAVVLKKGTATSIVIDNELHSDGSYHDVCYIPGGALANPDDPALYRLQLDKQRYDKAPKARWLIALIETLLLRNEINPEDVVFGLYPNLSAEDQTRFADAAGFGPGQLDTGNLKSHGHLQGTDLVLNYLSMIDSGAVETGQYVVAASHGMGFLGGASLLRL
jgi:3-oxoacyl-[acyl-carrier-protein] synthase-3